MVELATQIIRTFTKLSVTLSTCESLTGGALGARLTEVPGASKVYRGGVIAYASELKSRLVGVDAEFIETQGVINESTALQMALGVQRRCDTEWAIALTGVAGPDRQDDQEVGTVWFAVVGPRIGQNHPCCTEVRRFDGDRESIRAQSVDSALQMLIRVAGLE